MPMNILSASYDLSKYPDIEIGHDDIVFPHLDSNVLLLTYLLIKYDIIKMSKEEYQWLRQLFLAPPNLLTNQHIQNYNQLVDRLEVNDYKSLSFLDGLFHGNGQNDYFTLKLLSQVQKNIPMKQKGCKVDILLSKDILALLQLTQPAGSDAVPFRLNIQAQQSFKAMLDYVKRGLITEADILNLIKVVISQHIKLFRIPSQAPGTKELTLIGSYPHNTELLIEMYQELNGQLLPDQPSASTVISCISWINHYVKTLLERKVFFSTMHTKLNDCINTKNHSPFLAYLLNTLAEEKLTLTTSLRDEIQCHTVFNQKNARTQSDKALTSRQDSPTTGNIDVGSMPTRFLSYSLVADKNPQSKRLHLIYQVQRDKFTIGNLTHDFLVPASMTDEEVIRRLQLIYGDGEAEHFFPKITDTTQRQLIKEDLKRIRYQGERNFQLRKIEPFRGLLDFFNNTADATIAPLDQSPNVEGDWNMPPSQQNKEALDIHLTYKVKALEIKTGYRYFPPAPLNKKEVNKRMAQAFSTSFYPYGELYTLFSTHYKDKPREESPQQKTGPLIHYTILSEQSDSDSNQHEYWDFSSMNTSPIKSDTDEQKTDGIKYSSV